MSKEAVQLLINTNALDNTANKLFHQALFSQFFPQKSFIKFGQQNRIPQLLPA
jgi:plasmid rolling circle replication initiator protein Rep